MADQLRWDALGNHTPTINRLLEESIVFPRAYCASPICVPARGAFFTGQYPNRTGSIINPWEPLDSRHGNVRAGTPNLYSMLETKWDSHHVGKQHLFTEERIHEPPDAKTDWNSLEKGYKPFLAEQGHRAPGGDRFRGIVPEMVDGRITRARRYSVPTVGCYEPGFDSFFDGYIANTALDAIHGRDRTKPLLLNAMFVAPHPPYDIPEPWYSMIEDVELPESVGRWYADQSPLQLYNLPGAIGVRYSREDWHRVWQVYLGLVALLDHAVGMIVGALKDEGIYDDTLILFCSDHGEMLGSHMMYQKMCMYEPSVRTPLAWKLPAGSAASPGAVDALVSAIDVLPTICELTGEEAPAGIDGQSLVPLMRGEPGGRERVFIQFDGNGARGNFQRTVVEGEYKLIVDLFKDEQYLELYNVVADPEETANLAFEPDQRERLTSLVATLRWHMTETGDLLTLRENTVESFINEYTPVRNSVRR
jgi:arylsulfatase A-like enzyme